MPTKNTNKKSTAKPAAKKAVTKKAAAPRAKKTIIIPAPEMAMHDCGCHHNHENACMCGHDCPCTRKCGCGFGRFLKKLIITILLLAIGFFIGATVTKSCPRKAMMHGPRVEFAPNGCLVPESVKNEKLHAALPAMDINQDGCITRDEFRAVKKKMRREIREIPVQEAENPAPAADAPVVTE